MELAEQHFVVDDWGFVKSIEADIDEDQVFVVQKAIDSCPIVAISWIE
jgi:ferredoxin